MLWRRQRCRWFLNPRACIAASNQHAGIPGGSRQMFKRILKWLGAIIGLLVIAFGVFLINLIWFRPWSLNLFYEKVFAEVLFDHPELLSTLGLVEQFGITNHNGKLDEESPEHQQRECDRWKRDLTQLREYPLDRQSPSQKLSTHVLDWFLQMQVEGEKWQWHNYPVNQLFGVQNQFPSFMANTHRLLSRKDCEYYLKRLDALPKKFDQLLENLKIREQKQILPPRFVVEEVLKEMTDFIGTPASENILASSFKTRAAKIAELSEAQRADFKEATAPGAYYQPGAMDGTRPGIFFANLRDMNEVPKWSMPTLAYHEGVPGHHWQISTAEELKAVPQFRKVIPFTAYMEGWALYCEWLAKQAGWYENDPFGDLGRLRDELFRAVRLLVDTGIHAKHWTREQAIAYMREKTGMGEKEVKSEIERYIVAPGQACAYKIGMLKIRELRARAEDELGERFDQREFHDAVLKNGALPLEILEEQVNEYIQRKKSA